MMHSDFASDQMCRSVPVSRGGWIHHPYLFAKPLADGQFFKHFQKSFSACSHDKQFDEREYIDEVVKQPVSMHIIFTLRWRTLFTRLEEIIWHQDEPFGSASIYAQWNVFGLASRTASRSCSTGRERMNILPDTTPSLLCGRHRC